MSRPIARPSPAALLLVVTAGCGQERQDQDSSKTSTSAATSSTATHHRPRLAARACQPAQGQEQGSRSTSPSPRCSCRATSPPTLVLTTNCGEIDIALDVKRARNAPRRRSPTSCARASTTGCRSTASRSCRPAATSSSRAATRRATATAGPGYSVREKPPSGLRYSRGVVAMAKTEIEPAGHLRQPVLHRHRARTPACPPSTPCWAGDQRRRRRRQASPRSAEQGADGPPAQPVVISKATLRAG